MNINSKSSYERLYDSILFPLIISSVLASFFNIFSLIWVILLLLYSLGIWRTKNSILNLILNLNTLLIIIISSSYIFYIFSRLGEIISDNLTLPILTTILIYLIKIFLSNYKLRLQVTESLSYIIMSSTIVFLCIIFVLLRYDNGLRLPLISTSGDTAVHFTIVKTIIAENNLLYFSNNDQLRNGELNYPQAFHSVVAFFPRMVFGSINLNSENEEILLLNYYTLAVALVFTLLSSNVFLIVEFFRTKNNVFLNNYYLLIGLPIFFAIFWQSFYYFHSFLFCLVLISFMIILSILDKANSKTVFLLISMCVMSIILSWTLMLLIAVGFTAFVILSNTESGKLKFRKLMILFIISCISVIPNLLQLLSDDKYLSVINSSGGIIKYSPVDMLVFIGLSICFITSSIELKVKRYMTVYISLVLLSYLFIFMINFFASREESYYASKIVLSLSIPFFVLCMWMVSKLYVQVRKYRVDPLILLSLFLLTSSLLVYIYPGISKSTIFINHPFLLNKEYLNRALLLLARDDQKQPKVYIFVNDTGNYWKYRSLLINNYEIVNEYNSYNFDVIKPSCGMASSSAMLEDTIFFDPEQGCDGY